jgi:protein involved in polysaccharide export with SLBB domain
MPDCRRMNWNVPAKLVLSFTLVLVALGLFTGGARAQFEDLFVQPTDQTEFPTNIDPWRTNGADDLQATNQVPGVDLGRLLETSDAEEIRPFGWQLFDLSALGTNVARPTGINPEYVVSPGDRIVVQLWGARVAAYELTVDAQGNILIPEVGPIRVGGLSQGNLNSVVANAVGTVFTEQVQTYTNLLGTQPIGVYVTGAVPRPSLYAGDRRDSLLYFLGQAGGIALDRGSFRAISVIRDGQVLTTIDLYDFLLDGELPTFQFANNDTILVHPIKSVVTVSGAVRNAYAFEITDPLISGDDILAMARPEPDATNAMVRGIRNGVPYNTYLSLAALGDVAIHDGDTLVVESDLVEDTIFVNVVGHMAGPSAYVLHRGVRLSDFLDVVAVNPAVADIRAIYLKRESVAESQKAALEHALDELQRTVLTAASSSSTESKIRSADAALIERYIQRARDVEPEGRIYLGGDPASAGLLLEDGDTIVIPQKSDVVMISGEVRLPQTMVYKPLSDIDDYIVQAGGYTDRADHSGVLVLRLGGEILHGGNPEILPGDHILVLPSAGDKSFAIIKDVVEVIFRSVLSVGVIYSILEN